MHNTSRLALKLMACTFLVTIAVGSTGGPASATHSWNGYHWGWNLSEAIPLMLGNNVDSTWTPYLAAASNDWSSNPLGGPDVFNTEVVSGGTNPKTCQATSGMVQVCAAKYGYNGWLGVAQIWLTGSHITKGTVKLNDSYFSSPTYNDSNWRHMVVCQEVGHTLGLDHQDENFANPNLGTCMDYTNDPTGSTSPNGHDYEELSVVYGHLDSSSTVSTGEPVASSGPGKGNGKGKGNGASGVQLVSTDPPSDNWGRAVRFTSDGKGRVFIKDLSRTERVVTFVTWAR